VGVGVIRVPIHCNLTGQGLTDFGIGNCNQSWERGFTSLSCGIAGGVVALVIGVPTPERVDIGLAIPEGGTGM